MPGHLLITHNSILLKNKSFRSPCDIRFVIMKVAYNTDQLSIAFAGTHTLAIAVDTKLAAFVKVSAISNLFLLVDVPDPALLNIELIWCVI